MYTLLNCIAAQSPTNKYDTIATLQAWRNEQARQSPELSNILNKSVVKPYICNGLKHDVA